MLICETLWNTDGTTFCVRQSIRVLIVTQQTAKPAYTAQKRSYNKSTSEDWRMTTTYLLSTSIYIIYIICIYVHIILSSECSSTLSDLSHSSVTSRLMQWNRMERLRFPKVGKVQYQYSVSALSVPWIDELAKQQAEEKTHGFTMVHQWQKPPLLPLLKLYLSQGLILRDLQWARAGACASRWSLDGKRCLGPIL